MSTIDSYPRFINMTVGFVFPHECEYAKGHYGDLNFVISENVVGDPGGLTKWGIDKKSHPAVDIEHLTQNDAENIYWEKYWNGGQDDHNALIPVCSMMSVGLGEVYYDARINCGKGRARVLLASAGNSWEKFMLERESFYHRLVEQKPKFAKFITGWLNRTTDLRAYVKKIL